MKFHIVKLYEIMLICIKSHKFMSNNQKTMIRTSAVHKVKFRKDKANIPSTTTTIHFTITHTVVSVGYRVY